MDHDSSHHSADSHATTSHVDEARRLVLGLIGGVVAGLAILVGLLFAMRPAPLPTLTAETLEAARQKWAQAGPANYDLELKIAGRQPGVVEVQVRDGQVTQMKRDGVEPAERRTWAYWSVPAQFDTLEEELNNVHKAASGYEGARLEAQFDPHYGYPARYRRIVTSNDLSMSWEVTRFAPQGEQAHTEPVGEQAHTEQGSATPESP